MKSKCLLRVHDFAEVAILGYYLLGRPGPIRALELTIRLGSKFTGS